MAIEETVATTDRISELPELVLHCILSFLPIKEAARTSILSKRWSSMWETLPYLNFGEGFFLNHFYRKERFNVRKMKKNKSLLDVADRIILRHRQQNSSIEKLHFIIPEHKLSKRQKLRYNLLFFKIKRWVSFVARSSLRELELINQTNCLLCLPSRILLAKSLSVLCLCDFSLRWLSSHDIKFPSLRKLQLSAVYMDDHIMGNIIRGSPLLESLQLNFCHGLETVCVNGLFKLNLLEVRNMWHMKVLEIDAPELLDLYMFCVSAERSFSLNIPYHLRKLLIGGKFITEKWLYHFVSQCKFLEYLVIYPSSKLKNVKISSDTLKIVELIKSEYLQEVEITAPLLEKFTFQALTLPTVLLHAPDMLEVLLDFYCWQVDFGYDKLAIFLGYFNHFKTVTFNYLQDKDIIPKDERTSLLSPLCGTRNLACSVNKVDIAAVELVEYMLWLSPRVWKLSIINNPFENIIHALLEFVYDQKNDHEDLCWQHCLTEVRVEKFDGDEDEMTKMKNFFLEHAKNLKIFEAPPSDHFCDGLYSLYKLFLDEDL